MGTITEELNRIIAAKASIISALKEKGQNIDDDILISDLVPIVQNIEVAPKVRDYTKVSVSSDSYIMFDGPVGTQFTLGTFSTKSSTEIKVRSNVNGGSYSVWHWSHSEYDGDWTYDAGGSYYHKRYLSQSSYMSYMKSQGYASYDLSSAHTIKTRITAPTNGVSGWYNIAVIRDNIQMSTQQTSYSTYTSSPVIKCGSTSYATYVYEFNLYEYGTSNLIAHYIPWVENGEYCFVDTVSGTLYHADAGTASGSVTIENEGYE